MSENNEAKNATRKVYLKENLVLTTKGFEIGDEQKRKKNSKKIK